MRSPLVLGVEGCNKGWIGIAISAAVTAHFGTTIGDLVQLIEEQVGRPDVVAIDIPIGLPDLTVRDADRLARAMVGPRRMSVFFTPTRHALRQADYAAALIVNRELTGGGFSQQAWALRTKILEVDAWARTSTSSVLEVHPEFSYATMAGVPLPARKSSYAGFQQRQNLLTANGISLPPDLGVAGDLGGVDDVLDAAAAAWSGQRYARGEPPTPPPRLWRAAPGAGRRQCAGRAASGGCQGRRIDLACSRSARFGQVLSMPGLRPADSAEGGASGGVGRRTSLRSRECRRRPTTLALLTVGRRGIGGARDSRKGWARAPNRISRHTARRCAPALPSRPRRCGGQGRRLRRSRPCG